MKLIGLGNHAELSPAMPSKLENARVEPTIPTLMKVALVFGVGLEYFLEPERRTIEVVKKKA